MELYSKVKIFENNLRKKIPDTSVRQTGMSFLGDIMKYFLFSDLYTNKYNIRGTLADTVANK